MAVLTQIVFRTNASLEVGIGHILRCLTLAQSVLSFYFNERIGFTFKGKLRSHHYTEIGFQDAHSFGFLVKNVKHLRDCRDYKTDLEFK